jgi:hypothetical protein
VKVLPASCHILLCDLFQQICFCWFSFAISLPRVTNIALFSVIMYLDIL